MALYVKGYESEEAYKRKNDVLLITADGKTLLDDLRVFLGWSVPHDVMAVGRSIKAYPGKVLHWAEVDADASNWVAENLEKNHPDKACNGKIFKHTLGKHKGFDFDWDVEGYEGSMDDVMWHGSTALFAVMIALEMEYKPIVLAGVPLDSKGHWYFDDETYGPHWVAETYQAWFEFNLSENAQHVRSMSGYTMQILGKANKKWLS